MTITAFSPANLRPLREELDAALKAVADRHGIKFVIGKMTYDHTGTEFSAKITATTGGTEDRAAQQAIMLAKLRGVDASTPSTHPRATGAKLVDYRSRAGLRPWVYEQGGKQFVTTDAGLAQMWPKVTQESPIG